VPPRAAAVEQTTGSKARAITQAAESRGSAAAGRASGRDGGRLAAGPDLPSRGTRAAGVRSTHRRQQARDQRPAFGP
jgi:hypothetical protein